MSKWKKHLHLLSRRSINQSILRIKEIFSVKSHRILLPDASQPETQ